MALDGSAVTAAIEAESAACNRWHEAVAAYMAVKSDDAREEMIAAAHAFSDAGQQVRKIMRIDEIVANPNKIRW